MATTAPTYAEFIATYTGLASVPQAQVESQLSLSSRLLDTTAWGDFYSDAVGLDAAHNLTLMQQMASGLQGAGQAAVGPVTSVSVAGISTSFATPSLNTKSKADNWYMKTGYGQMFLRLRDTVIPPGFMADSI